MADIKDKKRVLVAMSGGVDSSVAAALLKKDGYEVEGAYMKNFSPESWQGVISKDCPWENDVKDVEKVCKKLDISWRSFNFEDEYQGKVIDYFFDEYAKGKTPNPDVMCNKEIKFGVFLQKAKELDFDFIATGHYVRLDRTISRKQHNFLPARKFASLSSRHSAFGETKLSGLQDVPQNSSVSPVLSLFAAKDENKDQSYFLWSLNQEQLKHCLFPIGDYTKPQVRELAREFNLPNSEKKDSQGLCFVGHIKLKEFLSQRLPQKPGVVMTVDGKTVGRHEGVCSYTIGQRKGIGLPNGPYFVADKDAEKNILFITNDEKDLYKDSLIIGEVNWISGKKPNIPLRIMVKIRYRAKSVPAMLSQVESGIYKLVFDEPQRAIASGQSAVIYNKEEMLGGGIIQ